MSVEKTFFAEMAWLGGPDVAHDVLITCSNGLISAVTPNSSRPPESYRLTGLTLPGLVNSHSHVFHRALRARTQGNAGDFWSWRTLMYQLADRLDPDSLFVLARATYAEMSLAGITTVGEFHYLHHGPRGVPYDDPNETGRALIRAAADVGIRLTLLDTCYLQADVAGSPLDSTQERFGDGTWDRWAERVDSLAATPLTRIGAAIHSVRAVPRSSLGPIARLAERRGYPLHFHLSEQPAENEATRAAYGMSPTEVMAAEGVLGRGASAVHATHLTDSDIGQLAGSGSTVVMCPTTEADLADGIGPALALSRAGSALAVGSDGQTVIDLFEEARAMEMHQRLASGVRGNFEGGTLLSTLTRSGAESLGWNTGVIAPNQQADFTTVSMDTPRMAGARSGHPLASAVFAASASDVTDVVVAGEPIVADGHHLRVPDVGPALARAIAALVD